MNLPCFFIEIKSLWIWNTQWIVKSKRKKELPARSPRRPCRWKGAGWRHSIWENGFEGFVEKLIDMRELIQIPVESIERFQVVGEERPAVEFPEAAEFLQEGFAVGRVFPTVGNG